MSRSASPESSSELVAPSPSIRIDRLSIRLPSSLGHHAPYLGTQLGEALRDTSVATGGQVDHLHVGPIRVASCVSTGELARAVLQEVTRTLSGRQR